MKKKKSYDELLDAAVAAGDLNEACRLFEGTFWQPIVTGWDQTLTRFGSQLREAVVCASQKDPEGLSMRVLGRILAVQIALMQRVEFTTMREVERYDLAISDPSKWGGLPGNVVDEHLPRLGKLQAEVISTVKLMNAIQKQQAINHEPKSE